MLYFESKCYYGILFTTYWSVLSADWIVLFLNVSNSTNDI